MEVSGGSHSFPSCLISAVGGEQSHTAESFSAHVSVTSEQVGGSSLVCEHETSALTCDDGTVIHIHSANYGRTDSSMCSTGRPPAQLAKIDCYALNSQTVVASGCEGKSSCSILASNSVFSDPCFGTFKYLYISYSCVSK
ncbi:D-galactoside-specific lectin-like [Sinocyclocheilus anshuiensis]|uniref:D-galactoside-specific lectin-like n=1 Tax=Sinocyclocheilus anshuiensis TaxID=1608454 RepID=UPI0007B959C8|nr:PREDICTED: D-galactoside-specific lectin-like [Sinocyclocheilus anshuiensis]